MGVDHHQHISTLGGSAHHPEQLQMDRQSWEALRQDARLIERQLDDKIEALQKKSNVDIESPMMRDSPRSSLSAEIEGLLSKLRDCNSAIDRVATSGGYQMQQTAQRHHEILDDHQEEFNKVQSECAELFSGVKNSSDMSSAAQHLLRERSALGASHAAADAAIGTAMAARDSMSEQNSMMEGIASKLQGVTKQFPAINQVVGAVQDKKTRDQLIVAATIAFYCFFTIKYLFLD